MNTTKLERVQKQIQKIKNRKQTLEKSLDKNYKNLLDYILQNKTYNYYQKIYNLLNIDDSLSKYINTLNDEQNLDSLITNQLYCNMLLHIKQINNNHFSNREILDIDIQIRDLNDQNIYTNNRKVKLNEQKKEMTKEYINIPKKLLDQLLLEKENIFKVISRIEQLEELNNNNFYNNFEKLYLDIKNIESNISLKKQEINNQNNVINEMKTQNLKCRKDKVNQIQKFKEMKKKIDQDKNKLKIQINNIDKSINQYVVNVNNLKLEIRILNQQITEENYQNNIDLIEDKNNKIKLFKKKVDYLNQEKNRYSKQLSNYINNLNENLNKPKIITKHEISNQKNKLYSLISQLNNLELLKKNTINNQKLLILNNLDYNQQLNKEFERSKDRLIIISKRINNSLNTDKNKLITELKQIDYKILIEDQNKSKNIETINTLNITKKTKYRDLEFLKDKFDIINKIKKSIAEIDTDLKSYEKIIK